jgi:hypothetical protein
LAEFDDCHTLYIFSEDFYLSLRDQEGQI